MFYHHLRKQVFMYVAIPFIACGQSSTFDKQSKTDKNTKQLPESLSKPTDGSKIEHVNKTYLIGDVNNDKIADTAFVVYDRSIKPDGTIEKDCLNKDCEVKVRFNNNIPDLVANQSIDIVIKQMDDVDNDGANEILLFSHWFEGYWNAVYVWTLKKGKWNEIARTKAFISEDNDFENRILKSGSQFYLIGDGWNDSQGGVTKRSLKVKVGK